MLSDATRRDLRLALRSLRQHRGFAVVAVLTLALGIGATTAIVSVIHGVLLRPLPYAAADRLVRVERPAGGIDGIDVGFSVADVRDFRARGRSLAGLAEYHSMTFNLVSRGQPLRAQTGVVSANYFDVLGVRPVLGRAFRPGDDEHGAAPVLVLSHEFWQRVLGGDPNVVGRAIEMTGRMHTVVGVLPPLPTLMAAEVYMPTPSCPFRSDPQTIADRTRRMVAAVGRLRPGVTVAQAKADLAAVSAQLTAEYPAAYPPSVRLGVAVDPMRDRLRRDARQPLLVLAATAAFVLLIACANVANLLVVRLVGRERELAVRAALGAGRGRLARQVLAESTVLALAGAGLGVAFAAGGVRVLAAAMERVTPLAGAIRLDGVVLLAAVALGLVAGALVGGVAFLSTRDGLSRVLGGRGAAAGATVRKRRIEGGLVVVQFAVTAVLLVGAGLMLRTLDRLYRVDPGFDPERVLTMRVTPDGPRYAPAAGRAAFHEQLVARVAAQPGVVSAAVAGTFPLNEEGSGIAEFVIEGRPDAAGGSQPHAETRVVTPGYLRTLGVPLLAGRGFTDADQDGAPPVALVNQTAARRYWGSANPVGTRVTPNGGRNWVTIVGVVGDVKQTGLDRPAEEEIYRPMAQAPIAGGVLLVRTTGDPLRAAGMARAAVAALDPRVPVDKVRTLDAVRDGTMTGWRVVTAMLGMFAVLALAMAATGVGSVLAFSVGQRTNEFGVRMALGATRGPVVRQVMGQGLGLTAAGLAVGLAGAAGFGRVMSALLFGVSPADPVTLAGVAAVLLLVAAAACYIPARRATTVDPLTALRHD